MDAELYEARQNEKLAEQILALPDDIVISYDFQGKHYAYTAEYVKRVMLEWQMMKKCAADGITYCPPCPNCQHLHRYGACGICDCKSEKLSNSHINDTTKSGKSQ